MDTTKIALHVIAEAETRLRELVAQAASAGEYDALQRIADWARTLASIRCEADRTADDNSHPQSIACPPGLSVDGDSRGPRVRQSTPMVEDGHRKKGSMPHRVKRAPAKGEYPKFYRRGTQLVKVGWSKTERDEYEHKAPLPAVEALANAIDGRSHNGKTFTAEEFLPLKDPHEGSEFPGYQVYVALAWFKTTGMITQHGRSGYTLTKKAALAEAVRKAWSELSEQAV